MSFGRHDKNNEKQSKHEPPSDEALRFVYESLIDNALESVDFESWTPKTVFNFDRVQRQFSPKLEGMQLPTKALRDYAMGRLQKKFDDAATNARPKILLGYLAVALAVPTRNLYLSELDFCPVFTQQMYFAGMLASLDPTGPVSLFKDSQRLDITKAEKHQDIRLRLATRHSVLRDIVNAASKNSWIWSQSANIKALPANSPQDNTVFAIDAGVAASMILENSWKKLESGNTRGVLVTRLIEYSRAMSENIESIDDSDTQWMNYGDADSRQRLALRALVVIAMDITDHPTGADTEIYKFLMEHQQLPTPVTHEEQLKLEAELGETPPTAGFIYAGDAAYTALLSTARQMLRR
jgi:hypothetical protein